MSRMVARQGDIVVGLDTHIILVASPGGAIPTPIPCPFQGPIVSNLSVSTFIDNRAVALVGSMASNSPPHIPVGGPFQRNPSNEGVITRGSTKVFVDGRAVARNGDPVQCCNDPTDQETGQVIAHCSTYAD